MGEKCKNERILIKGRNETMNVTAMYRCGINFGLIH